MTITIHRGINQSDGCITGNGGVKNNYLAD